jgi:hypothetical protein
MLGSDSLLYVPVTGLATTTKQGSVNKLSGNATDYIGGDNACHPFGAAISTDPYNQATLGSDSRIYVPEPLHYDAIHNGIFRFNQRVPYTSSPNIVIPTGAVSIKGPDRWFLIKSGAFVGNSTRISPQAYSDPGATPLYPQLDKATRISCATAMSTVAAGDYFELAQNVRFETGQTMFIYPTSILVVLRATVNGTFSASLVNADGTQSIAFPCVYNNAPNYQNFIINNIPVMPYNSGNWNDSNGVAFSLRLIFYAGATFQTPNSGVWQSGTLIAHSSQSNFFAAVNNVVDVLVIRHVIGAKILPFIPIDRDTDLGHCQRFFTKSYAVETAIGAGAGAGNYATAVYIATIPTTGGSLYIRVPFPRDMYKTPTMQAWHHSNASTPNQMLIQGSTGAVTGQVSSIGATASGLSNISVSSVNGAPGAPTEGYFDWTADAE